MKSLFEFPHIKANDKTTHAPINRLRIPIKSCENLAKAFVNFVELLVISNYVAGNLDFLRKMAKKPSKNCLCFHPVTSIIDSHESRTGNHNLHVQKFTNQINLFKNTTQSEHSKTDPPKTLKIKEISRCYLSSQDHILMEPAQFQKEKHL